METHLRIPAGDRRHYVDEADVAVVLARLPPDLTARLRAVHFTDEARGNRTLGYTTKRGRREIALCALPPHVSLNGFMEGPTRTTARMFGAVTGAQWPPLAVRRFMLYDVLLHEIGHLQIVDEKARSARRQFAHETVAEDFAIQWREELWSKPFAHEDPVHNPPSAEELAALSRWSEAHAEDKRGLGAEGNEATGHFARAVELFPDHSLALTKLAMCVVKNASVEDHSRSEAVELLGRALRVDPIHPAANLYMGWNCGHLGRYEDARHYIARAVRYGWMSAAQLAGAGDAHADWGFLLDAERFFRRSLALAPERARTLRCYARAVWDLGSDTPQEASRALALFERAIAAEPGDPQSLYHFARALATIPGENARAFHHAERSLELGPTSEDTRELVARLREPLRDDEAAHLVRETWSTRRFHRTTGEVIEDES